MDCLTDAELQAVADNEATDANRAHVASCARCRQGADARREQMTALVALAHSEQDVPPALEARLREAVASARPSRGSTALRHPTAAGGRRPIPWASALATAAAVGLIVFLVLPRFGAPTSLSASEILGRSLQTLSSARGIEQVEYELVFTGLPGPHRIVQLLDHEHPSRYRIADFGPDGALQAAISQDPLVNRRWHLVRVDGRNYIFELTTANAHVLSLPQIAQAQIEAVIGMMQATSDQKLTAVVTPGGTQYVIQIPTMTPSSGAAVVDLYQARVVINGGDFSIQELEASGALLKQPYSLSFKLIRRVARQAAEVPASEFAIVAGPGDVVLEGEATTDPLTDLLSPVLRELGRIKGL